MKNLQPTADKVAISMSILCLLHCLVLPLMMALTPSILALPMSDEAFHIWMIIGVVPISFYALTMGCKNHKRHQVLYLGGIGMLILSVAAFFGHDLLSEVLEKALTAIGALIIAIAHIRNYRLCQYQNICACAK